jgi:hypothetical protein
MKPNLSGPVCQNKKQLIKKRKKNCHGLHELAQFFKRKKYILKGKEGKN